MELKGNKDEMMQDETSNSHEIFLISQLYLPNSKQDFSDSIYDFRKDLNKISKCAQICQYTKIYQRSRYIPVYALNILFSAIQQQQ